MKYVSKLTLCRRCRCHESARNSQITIIFVDFYYYDVSSFFSSFVRSFLSSFCSLFVLSFSMCPSGLGWILIELKRARALALALSSFFIICTPEMLSLLYQTEWKHLRNFYEENKSRSRPSDECASFYGVWLWGAKKRREDNGRLRDKLKEWRSKKKDTHSLNNYRGIGAFRFSATHSRRHRIKKQMTSFPYRHSVLTS